MRHLALLLFLAGLCLLPGHAANKKKITPFKPGLQITGLDSSAQTVTVTDQTDHEQITYRLSQATTITINGKPSQFNDLKKGMMVKGTHISIDDSGHSVLDDLAIDGKGNTEKKKK